MSNLKTLSIALLAAFLLALPLAAAEPAARPNIIWLMAEDLGLDLACYGMPAVRTPHLDALSREGALFTRAICPNPICSPNRSSMMVGVDPTEFGAQHHRSNRDVPLMDPYRPITAYLRDAGYTCLLGHSLVKNQGRKIDCNFRFTPTGPYDGVERFGLFDQKADFSAADQPFFSQIQLAVTHRGDWWADVRTQSADPVALDAVVLPPFIPDTPETRYDWAVYLDTVEFMDREVGAVMSALREQGLAENTVVVFIGDNGRCNVRGKGYLHASGIHVPMIVWAPGRVEPGTVVDGLVNTSNVSATVLALAGVERPAYMRARPLLHGDGTPGINFAALRTYVRSARDVWDEIDDCSRSITTRRFKYIRNEHPERPWDQRHAYQELNRPALHVMRRLKRMGLLSQAQGVFVSEHKPDEELYDLVVDPYELVNLASAPAFARVLASLRAVEDRHRAAHRDFGLEDLGRRRPARDLAGERARDGIRAGDPDTWTRLTGGELMKPGQLMRRYRLPVRPAEAGE